MTEDEELLARKELLDLRYLLGRDGRDGIALILFGIALDEDTGGRFEAREHDYEISNYRFQFNMTKPARQTKIPAILTHEILSLKTKIATGTRINEAATLTSTAAIPRFQPER